MADHEGIVRQMLVEFQHHNYLTTSQSGVLLTPKGHEFLEKQMAHYQISAIRPVETPFFQDPLIAIGLHLKASASRIISAMQLRDIAVKGGATGAIILIYTNNQLTVPSVTPDYLSKNPTLTQTIENHFHLINNDILVIIGAATLWKGIEAALVIALSLASAPS